MVTKKKACSLKPTLNMPNTPRPVTLATTSCERTDRPPGDVQYTVHHQSRKKTLSASTDLVATIVSQARIY